MNALPETLPMTANFPPPVMPSAEKKIQFPIPGRKPQARIKFPSKPSVDKALQRMSMDEPEKDHPSLTGDDDCRAPFEEEEEELREKQREFARLKAETLERIRAAKELEILLNARERILDEREAALKGDRNNVAGNTGELAEKEAVISQLRTEIEVLKNAQSGAGNPSARVTDAPGLDSVTHESLADQVTFLKEREAYIEQSENVLFDKAQKLQEWETRLQQREHDLENA
jgi:uncharacterized protein (DUF3084 family)